MRRLDKEMQAKAAMVIYRAQKEGRTSLPHDVVNQWVNSQPGDHFSIAGDSHFYDAMYAHGWRKRRSRIGCGDYYDPTASKTDDLDDLIKKAEASHSPPVVDQPQAPDRKLFEALLEAVSEEFPSDQTRPGVVMSKVRPDCWYVSIARYPAGKKEIVSFCKADTLSIAIKICTIDFAVKTNRLDLAREALK
jgi:hypothetical protein